MTEEVKISLTREQALEFLEWTKPLPNHKVIDELIESIIWKFDIEYDVMTGKYMYIEEIIQE